MEQYYRPMIYALTSVDCVTLTCYSTTVNRSDVYTLVIVTANE